MSINGQIICMFSHMPAIVEVPHIFRTGVNTIAPEELIIIRTFFLPLLNLPISSSKILIINS